MLSSFKTRSFEKVYSSTMHRGGVELLDISIGNQRWGLCDYSFGYVGGCCAGSVYTEVEYLGG
jgi:hypothetical protein